MSRLMHIPPHKSYFARLKAVECPDATFEPIPPMPAVVLARGQGSLLWDTKGQSYIDLCAGFGVMALGHGVEGLQKALTSSQDPLIHGMGDVYGSTDKIVLLEALSAAITPPGETPFKGSLALSGGQAIEVALKTAMLYTPGGNHFIAFEGGYHGLDLGVLPITSRPEFRRGLTVAQTLASFLPYGATGAAVEAHLDGLAPHLRPCALVCEPIQGRGGVVVPPLGWLQEMKTVCQKRGMLLILDEVFTGMGRLGQLCHPPDLWDLVCLGKALGGGLPLSICLGKADIMDQAWAPCYGEALHTGTFFGHPLSCRVATSVLAQLQLEQLPLRAATLGEKAMAYLRDYLRTCPHGSAFCKDIRGRGLMIGLETLSPMGGVDLMHWLVSQGVIALASGPRGECLSLSPALNIPETQLYQALDAICAGLNYFGRSLS